MAPLIGRDPEMALLVRLMEGAGGAAMILRGEAGVGKSRLLDEAAREALERDMTVLSVAGVQTEAHLPFAGLHQLLRPVRDRTAELPQIQRDALDAAFGLTDGIAPEFFRFAMAALDLIVEVATEAPVVILVEDAQWLDRPTIEVLSFVARRIRSDPVVLLAAVRDGYPTGLIGVGLPEHKLAGLDDVAAAMLLDNTAPDLPLATRNRFLREAAGNPLALIELPAAADVGGTRHSPSSALPLTRRLERAFAGRAAELPEATRLTLLVAALSDGHDGDEVLQAATAVSGTPLDYDALQPAVDAMLLEPDITSIRFRHPLIRSAVQQSATAQQRRRAHQALADALTADPDRQVWHRAAIAGGVDESLAVGLETAGSRARRRGAISSAIAAQERAAELGEPEKRGQRLLVAASLAMKIGRRDLAHALLDDIEALTLDDEQQARLTWVTESVLHRPLGDGELSSLIAMAEKAGAAGDHDVHVELLWLVAQRAFSADIGRQVRQRLTGAARQLGGADADDPRVLAVYAYADPSGHAIVVINHLRSAATGSIDAESALYFGSSALAVGAFDLGVDFLAIAVDGLRTEGKIGALLEALVQYSYLTIRLGDWDLALTAADEARRLAEELSQPLVVAAAQTASAIIAALRGDDQTARRLAEQSDIAATSAGANITAAFAQFGKVFVALAEGHHTYAYAAAERLFVSGDSAYHPVISSWMIAELAGAARHVDQLDAARARVDQVEARVTDVPGDSIHVLIRHAKALLAEPDEAGGWFEQALAADLRRWPFERARIQLAYGRWLRRQRRVAESRAMLRAARDTFDALGSSPWHEQARQELRSSGERSRRRNREARDQLTAQELQIAQLAAQGLTNREIGQILFLSHRTIGTHLYRLFPKLGITSRAELAAVLNSQTDDG